MIDALLQDLRYGLRQLWRSPGFTLVAVLTLALGIGANTFIFGVVNGLLLRPLQVSAPDRLVALFATDRRTSETRALSYPEYLDYRDRSGIFAGLASQQGLPISLGGAERAEVVWGEIVSENYFSVLGLTPAIGRTFQQQDASGPGSDPLVVLSHRLWLGRFGGDPGVVGSAVILNGHRFTVVGVAPAGFTGTRKFGFWADLWVPMMMHAQVMAGSEGILEDRSRGWLYLFGRLRPGMTAGVAAERAATFAGGLEQSFPENRLRGARMLPARTGFDDPDGAPPRVIVLSAALALGAVGLILLLACANVANLLLARASARGREIAVRRALGASRARLLRQFLTESLLLALFGGAAGVALASWGTRVQSVMIPRLQFSVGFDVAPDTRVLLFAVAVTVLTALLFGLAPGLHAAGPDVVSTIKGGAGRHGWRRRRVEVRSLLVIAQVSLSLVLLVGGGLFLKSLVRAQRIEVGLARDHRLLLSLNPGLQDYDPARGKQFYRRLLDGVRHEPGVVAATLAFPLPLDTYGRSRTVFPQQGAVQGTGDGVDIGLSSVGLDYFETVGTSLVRGRDFGPGDSAGVDAVAIVNETMARRLWNTPDPVGREFRVGSAEGQVVRVIGVARDGKYGTIGESPRPYMYLPLEQDYRSGTTLVVHTRGDPAALTPAIRRVVGGLDPNLGTFGIMTMDEHFVNALNLARTSAMLAGGFGALALLLAVVGIYGVVSYSVARRTREVGVRLALGARPIDVLRLVLGNGLGIALVGTGIGLAAALPAAHLLGGMLYDVSPDDAGIFVSMSVLLTAVVLLATYLPARRAMRVDPMISLRTD